MMGSKVRGTWTVLAGVLAATAAAGGEQPVWIRAATPHFEIYTTESEARARNAILYLEEARAFFEDSRPAMRLPEQPVRIIAFRSASEYRPYSTSGQSPAHYQTGPARESIVLSGLAQDSYRSVVHEFVHLLVHSSGVKAPPWLDEGLAEVYSTLRMESQRRAVLGEAPPGHRQKLAAGKWLGLVTLLGAEEQSEYLNDPRFVPLFYAQSWALVHMLSLSDAYRPKFAALVERIAAGEDSSVAIERVYDKPLARIQEDMRAHLKEGKSMAILYPVRLGGPGAQPEIRAVTRLESGMVLAELLSGLPGRLAEGKQAYEELAREYPESCEPAEALVRLAKRGGTLEESRRQLSRAIRRGCSNPDLFLEYAREGPAAGDEISRAGLLRRALDLRPGDVGTELLLAMALYESGDYAEAREWMLRIVDVPGERGAEFFRALAYSDDRMGLLEEARSAARRAIEVSQSPEEMEAGLRLLEFLNRPPAVIPQVTALTAPQPSGQPTDPPPAPPVPAPAPARPATRLYRLEGELLRYDCLGGTARVWLQTGREKLALRITDGDGLIIRQGGRQMMRFFLCGAQKRERVSIEYEMARDAWLGTVGDVRLMEFR